ncbi:MAG: hypothetical protein GY809_26400 [Planctomycetes bacterium]|nr:hypothetical protein [Planctomycetota bacterium]
MGIVKNNRFMPFAVVFGLAIGLGVVAVHAAQEDATQELPGYYEFFAKTGKLTRLASEVKRDDAVKAGKMKPVAMNEPLKVKISCQACNDVLCYPRPKRLRYRLAWFHRPQNGIRSPGGRPGSDRSLSGYRSLSIPLFYEFNVAITWLFIELGARL